MRRRQSNPPVANPILPREVSKTVSLDADKTYRVTTGSDKTEMVRAAKMEVQPDGLTFKDGQGQVVGVFRGYGISAVVDERASAMQCDPCEKVKASDYI